MTGETHLVEGIEAEVFKLISEKTVSRTVLLKKIHSLFETENDPDRRRRPAQEAQGRHQPEHVQEDPDRQFRHRPGPHRPDLLIDGVGAVFPA